MFKTKYMILHIPSGKFLTGKCCRYFINTADPVYEFDLLTVCYGTPSVLTGYSRKSVIHALRYSRVYLPAADAPNFNVPTSVSEIITECEFIPISTPFSRLQCSLSKMFKTKIQPRLTLLKRMYSLIRQLH